MNAEEESLVGGNIESMLSVILPKQTSPYSRAPADHLAAIATKEEIPFLRRIKKQPDDSPTPNLFRSQEEKPPEIIAIPMATSSRRTEKSLPIGAKKVVQGVKREIEKNKLFLESAAWFTVQSLIISFFTEDILASILEWRSGFQVFLLMVAITIFWWYVVKEPLKKFSISLFDEGSRWENGVHTAIQLITTAFVLITAQYARIILNESWNVQSFSPTDRIAQLFVLALLLGDVIYTIREAEKLHLFDQQNQ